MSSGTFSVHASNLELPNIKVLADLSLVMFKSFQKHGGLTPTAYTSDQISAAVATSKLTSCCNTSSTVIAVWVNILVVFTAVRLA